jgi:hypothetical protein
LKAETQLLAARFWVAVASGLLAGIVAGAEGLLMPVSLRKTCVGSLLGREFKNTGDY